MEVMGLSIDRTSPPDRRTLFVTAKGDVYRSLDDGATWQKVDDCNGCRVTAVDAFDGSLVYAGGEIGLRRSTDGGNTWQQAGLPDMQGDPEIGFWDYGWEGIFDIQTDPHHTGWVYVTVFGPGKGLYRSKDRGLTWQKLLTDDFMRCVAISPRNENILYATSSSALEAGGYDPESHGVWFSMDGGATWTNVSDNMVWPFAASVAISTDGWVWVGSPARECRKPGFRERPRLSNRITGQQQRSFCSKTIPIPSIPKPPSAIAFRSQARLSWRFSTSPAGACAHWCAASRRQACTPCYGTAAMAREKICLPEFILSV